LLLLPAATSVHEWRPEGLPKIDIRQIRDNHRIIDEGWSFLKDPSFQEVALRHGVWGGSSADVLPHSCILSLYIHQ